jgi:hypothetical protein
MIRFVSIGCLLWWLSLGCPAVGQIQEDFSGPTLTSQTPWVGTPEYFVLQNGELRNNGPEATATLYLSSPNSLIDETEWSMKVRLAFNPSNNNFVRLYLVADKADLTDPTLQGYYIRIGVNGDQDAIDLFRQNGPTSTLILAGPPAQVAVAPTVRIKVTRSQAGLWKIWADLSGGTDFVEFIGEVSDATFPATHHFGVYLQQTTGNRQNFYFDDFYVGPERIDTEPPVVESVSVINATTLRVSFDEAVNEASAQTPEHYSVSGGIGQPLSALRMADNPRRVHLEFASPFVSQQAYTITINGVEDLSGNVLTAGQAQFTYFEAQPASPRDLLIHEIMANQSPPVGLPEFEYVELYNRSDKIIQLEGFTWSDPGATATLPARLIFPGEYLILCPSNAVEALSPFGAVQGISPWPVLNNSGDQLRLRNADGLQIDGVDYTDQWYRDSQKRNGGWSLELIDPENPCLDDLNWRASEDLAGGTPGKVNSVRASLPDVVGPKLLGAFAESPAILLLTFNERLDPPSVLGATFALSPAREIGGAEMVSGSGLRQVRLFLNQPLQGGIAYTVTAQNVRDCSGNLLQAAHAQATLALPEPGLPGDVVINEVLFNARTGGVKFVELFNASSKFLDLNSWQLANLSGDIPANFRTIATGPALFPPGSFRVITPDPALLKADYPAGKEETFLSIGSLPSYPITEGTVVLLSPASMVIDQLAYSERWHFSLLREVRGVSLERIRPDGPTQDPNNWRSAASQVGYATPGYLNSQSRTDISLAAGVRVEPEAILPDNTGDRDFATIHYRFPAASYVAHISIHDMTGREIREIAKNHLLAAEGFYVWDGTDNQGRKARTGYYVLRFEVFTPDGKTETIRKRIVVAARY